MRSVVLSSAAAKTLRRIPRNVADLIVSKIELYASDPGALTNNVMALKGLPGQKRLRIGGWRVILTEDLVVVTISKIAPRGGAYD